MKMFRGSFTALVTPMKENGAVDFDAYKNLLRFQMNEGIDGLVPLGTSGETPTLDEDEEDKIIALVMNEVKQFETEHGKKITVILGAGSNNTRDAVRYTERAKNAGADAALVVTPYYNKPSNEGLYRHFEAVSKVGIPIIVYNIQGRTGKNIDTETLCRIAELPNIAGVKEASGNINQMMDVIAKIKMKRTDFAVLCGDDALTLALMAAGGDGVVSVVSNLFPKRIADFVNAMLVGDFENARTMHYALLPFFKAAFVDGNPTSIKCAMAMKGLCENFVRLPLAPVSDDAKKIIEQAMKLVTRC